MPAAHRRKRPGLSADCYVRDRTFVLHQDREDIAAGRIRNATRDRSYVTIRLGPSAGPEYDKVCMCD